MQRRLAAPPVSAEWAAVEEVVLDGLAGPGFAVVERVFPEDFLDGLAADAREAWARGDYRRFGAGRDGGRASGRAVWMEKV